VKNVPEIAPEIRGLLEEIVANPRSAIKLAPRRALRTWFDTGETVRASDVTRTKAERHLVEVHREELAALLCEASWISYWKAPVLSPRPNGADGSLYDPTDLEPDWRRRASHEVDATSGSSSGIDLLRQCLDGIQHQQARPLAEASLGLVPSDKTRCYVALSSQWTKPRVAIHLYGRLLNARPSSLKPGILGNLAALNCHLGFLGEARRLYQEASALDPLCPYDRSCAFVLACILGDEKSAREEATELGKHFLPGDQRFQEAGTLLRQWRKSRPTNELLKSRVVFDHITEKIPEVARTLCLALNP
jgi:tetratricopeptide (TPR) repeat protein